MHVYKTSHHINNEILNVSSLCWRGEQGCLSLVVLVLSYVWLSVTPWTVAHNSPLSMGYFQQKYWSALPFLPTEDLPDQWSKWSFLLLLTPHVEQDGVSHLHVHCRSGRGQPRLNLSRTLRSHHAKLLGQPGWLRLRTCVCSLQPTRNTVPSASL